MKKTAENVIRWAAIASLLLLATSFPVLSQSNGDSAAVVVQMTDQVPMRFDPAKITIKAGQTVEWKNIAAGGGPDHNVTNDPSKVMDSRHVSSPAGAELFDSGSIKPGKSFSHKFTIPGVYNYACSPHEGSMRGQIIVQP